MLPSKESALNFEYTCCSLMVIGYVYQNSLIFISQTRLTEIMHSTSSKGFNHRDSGQRHPLMSWEEKLFLAVNRGDARSVKTLLTKGTYFDLINEIVFVVPLVYGIWCI